MNRTLRRIAVLGAATLLAACASAPTRFYTLMPQAGQAAAPTATAGYRIEVLPVSVPAQDDRPQLVVRQSDDRVALLEGDQWAAPLSDQIRAAVSDRLSSVLGAMDVYGLPRAGEGPVVRVKLDVRRFESVVGRQARIDAAWTVRGTTGKAPPLACRSALEEPVDGDGYGALVQAHQRALKALSDRIATVVRQVAAGQPAHCP